MLLLSLLIVFVTLNAVVLASNTNKNAANVRSVIDKFFLDDAEETKTSLRAVKSPLTGYAEFWMFSDKECSVTSEVLSMQMNECLEVSDYRWAKVHGTAAPHFSMQIEYFADRACTDKIQVPLTSTSFKDECRSLDKETFGKLKMKESMIQSINRPAIRYSIYPSAESCEKNPVEDAKVAMITPLDVCQYNGISDYVFTNNLSSFQLQKLQFASADGTCSGEATSTTLTSTTKSDASMDCQIPTNGGSYASYAHLEY